MLRHLLHPFKRRRSSVLLMAVLLISAHLIVAPATKACSIESCDQRSDGWNYYIASATGQWKCFCDVVRPLYAQIWAFENNCILLHASIGRWTIPVGNTLQSFSSIEAITAGYLQYCFTRLEIYTCASSQVEVFASSDACPGIGECGTIGSVCGQCLLENTFENQIACNNCGGIWDGLSGCCYCEECTPIIVDVEGNGFSLTNALGGVAFDIDNDGNQDQISWTSTGSDDAFLVLDRNGSGTIDSGAELFGSITPQPPSDEKNGFLALAEFDKPLNGGNNDGNITNADAVYSALRLWKDINHNGTSEASELFTLPDFNVLSLDLNYKESRRKDEHKNWFRYRAKVRDGHGTSVSRWAWDVFLVKQ